jgi:exodeoxyribonuclease VII small subunit
LAKKKKTFDESMKELQEILDKMSADDTSLEDMLEYYATAANLMKACKASLEEADVRIKEIDAFMHDEETGNGLS